MKSPVIKRSIRIAGHKTSISLEDDFWRALKEIAGERHKSLSALVAAIEGDRQHSNLSSAIRPALRAKVLPQPIFIEAGRRNVRVMSLMGDIGFLLPT